MADFSTTDADAAALSSSADLKARFEAITGADGGAGDALDLDAASAKQARARRSGLLPRSVLLPRSGPRRQCNAPALD